MGFFTILSIISLLPWIFFNRFARGFDRCISKRGPMPYDINSNVVERPHILNKMLGLTYELRLTYKATKTTIFINTQVNVIRGLQIL